jgi:hypothetical protein
LAKNKKQTKTPKTAVHRRVPQMALGALGGGGGGGGVVAVPFCYCFIVFAKHQGTGVCASS